MKDTRKFIYSAGLAAALFFVFAGAVAVTSTPVHAQTTDTFFVDEDFDKFGRTQVTATQRATGTTVEIFIENDYFNALSASAQNSTITTLQNYATTFDIEIYNQVRDVFGVEDNPGIDNNPRVVVLFVQSQSGIGGYFRSENTRPKSIFNTSNEKEMFYLNTDFINSTRQMEAFMAHEFQHLTNNYQKNHLRNVEEQTWLNELMSEVAPTVAGLNDQYLGSNLRSRQLSFNQTPSDDLLTWGNQSREYAQVSMLGHFLYDHYKAGLFEVVSQTSEVGISAINTALGSINVAERFRHVYRNWLVAVLLNDCQVPPQNQFCYLNEDLRNSVKITFEQGTDGGKEITQQQSVAPWQSSWLSYSRTIEAQQPDDHYFVFEFTKPSGTNFGLSYVVYPTEGKPQVYYATFSGNKVKFVVEDFGFKVSEVVVMPVYRKDEAGALATYNITAQVTATKPTDTTTVTPASQFSPLPEGALVRAEGDDKVYIIKGPYKRWVQDPAIIDMYGHLRWEDIMIVSKEQLDEIETVNVVRELNDEKVYAVFADNTKRWIETEEDFKALGYTFDMVYIINQSELNFYQTRQ